MSYNALNGRYTNFTRIFKCGSAFEFQSSKLLSLSFTKKCLVKVAYILDKQAVRDGRSIRFPYEILIGYNHWELGGFTGETGDSRTLTPKLKLLLEANICKSFKRIFLPKIIKYNGTSIDTVKELKGNWKGLLDVEIMNEEVKRHFIASKLFDA